MSIWLLIALIAYSTGVYIEWQRFQEKIQEWDEYSNFPIVRFAMMVVGFGYFLKALIWVYNLIGENLDENKTVEF
jgi:hypothetical protein